MKSLFYFNGMVLTMLLIGLGVAIPSTNNMAQPGEWTPLEPMAHARSYFAAAAWNEKIFVFGGVINADLSRDDVEMYDINLGTWVPRKKMPGKLCSMTAVTLGDKIYLIGGSTALSTSALSSVYEYDPVLDTFIAIASLPVPKMAHASAVLGNDIYVIGGGAAALGQLFNSVEKYNPSNGEGWVAVAPLNTPTGLLTADTLDGKIYAIGGAFDNTLEGLATIQVFDPASLGSWTQLDANLQQGRARHGSGVINGNIYVMGGASGAFDLQSVERINIPQGTEGWVLDTDMSLARRAFVAVEAGGKIYVAGGINGATGLNSFECFDPNINAVSDRTGTEAGLLVQNFPNPFGWQTTIQYEVTTPGNVSITIQDATNRLLRTVVNGNHFPGNYTVNLDANDIENGVYFYTLKTADGISITKKMVVLK
jgi:N-acetylneuraminic acid mutarotase